MTEGVFPKSDGDIFFASEANLLNGVMQIYTSTGFNSSDSTGTPDEHSLELTALTAAQLKAAKYIKITVFCKADACGDVIGSPGKVEFKIQEKYTGGAYADALAYTTIDEHILQNNPNGDVVARTLTYYYTLNSNDWTNGCQIKLFSKSTAGGGTSGVCYFTNIQTVEELC